MEALQFLLLGLGAGAVYAALALGVVLTYRGAGIINFAYGAMAMYPAYAFSVMRSDGDLVLPVIGLPDRISFGDTLGLFPALAVALGIAAFLGAAAHYLVFHPMRHAPVLAKVVASIGIMVVLQAIVVIKFGTGNISVSTVLPAEPVRMLGITMPRDRLYLAALVVVFAVVLWFIYRFTRFGLATRAAAENEKGSVLLGYSPDRLAVVNWVMASVLAGLFGILVGPITALSPSTYTLLIVPALAAALIGRFVSFGVTTAAALILGMLQMLILHLAGEWSWLPQIGTADALPFVVVIIAMAALGGRLPGRGFLGEGRMPAAIRARRPLVVAGTAALAGLTLVFVLDGAYLGSYVTSLIGAVVCLSLVTLTGYVGQISLAQMTFAGIAGFMLSKFAFTWGIPFPISPLLAIVVAVAAGVVAGLPALRVRGVHLAVVTIGLAIAVSEFVFKNPSYTGGFEGSPVPSPSIFGLTVGSGADRGFAVFVLVALVVAALLVFNLRRSATGLRMLAVRANERAAAAAGVNVAATKLMAFGVSAGLAGLAGVLLGYQQTNLSFESFGVLASLFFLAIAYLGGISTVSGGIVGGLLASGGLLFYTLDRAVGFGQYVLLASGIGLILTAVLNPEGIAGGFRLAVQLLTARLRGREPSSDAPAGARAESGKETVSP